MDVLAVRNAGLRAVDNARSGNGPTILEMKTYRYRGHSMSDPAKYRTRDEVDAVREKRDPIEHVKRLLLDGGLTDEARLKTIDQEIKGIVSDAAEFAQTSPEPSPDALMEDILLPA